MSNLTKAQRKLLFRAIDSNRVGVMAFNAREDNVAHRLVEKGLLRQCTIGGGFDFYLTPAGRAALNSEGA